MTHLDHQKEEARVVQLKEMLSLIDREKPHILMGDFNSLKKNDYTEEVWNVLTEIRKKNNWELPISDLTDSLERELGYTDTWAATLLQSGKEEEKIDYLFGTPTQTKSNPTRDNLWTRKVHKLATWYILLSFFYLLLQRTLSNEDIQLGRNTNRLHLDFAELSIPSYILSTH